MSEYHSQDDCNQQSQKREERREWWRRARNFFGRCMWGLIRPYGGFPDEYYDAKDLGDGGIQRLFGDDQKKQKR